MVSLNQFLKILCPIVLETCFAYTMTLLEKLGGGWEHTYAIEFKYTLRMLVKIYLVLRSKRQR